MANLPMKQLRDLNRRLQDAVEASVDLTEKLHLVMMRKPYAALEKIDAIAAPVHVIERVQHAVTLRVFQSIRIVNKIAVNVAGRVIDQMEATADGIKR